MSALTYLRFENPQIAGSATVAGHVGEIELLSWSHGFTQPTSPTRTDPDAAAEQARHSAFSFSKYHDAASTGLLRRCWSGEQIGGALVACYRSDGEGAPILYLEIEMRHVVVSNVSIGGGGGDLATETVTLDYGTITYRYRPGSNEAAEVSHDLIQRMVS